MFGMDNGDIILTGTSIVTVLGAVLTLVWEHRRDKNKPALDEVSTAQGRAELKRMVDETNSYRDYRIWQLEGYLDLDREWHREVVTQFTKLLDVLITMDREGHVPADIAFSDFRLPEPPRVPEPPRRGG